ncbi:hypothetical protein L3Y34_013765 [Caenorhabditis briggsae]|uniref:Uncharacterized protein n=1 Tax=Caenorhabditis briggsae TaxID=6238 RepID=A0AAE9A250_CAEBR|nr:hypothetical protein L3Y34_013765 [Caenorhabditis briggsae]
MARWSFFIAFCTWIPTGLLIFRSIYKVYKSNKIIKNSISTQLCVTVMNIVLSNLLVSMTDMALIRIPQSGFENAWFIEYENHPFVLAMYHLYLACSTYSRTLVVMLSVFRVVMAYYPKDHMYTNNWIGFSSRERSFRNELAWTLTTAACFYHFLEDTLVEIFSHLSQEIFGDLISILPFTHNIGNLFIAVIFWATHPIFGRNGLISTYRMETRNQ